MTDESRNRRANLIGDAVANVSLSDPIVHAGLRYYIDGHTSYAGALEAIIVEMAARNDTMTNHLLRMATHTNANFFIREEGTK